MGQGPKLSGNGVSPLTFCFFPPQSSVSLFRININLSSLLLVFHPVLIFPPCTFSVNPLAEQESFYPSIPAPPL